MVDYNGLENRRTERYRGFESLSLRKSLLKEISEGFFIFHICIFPSYSFTIHDKKTSNAKLCYIIWSYQRKHVTLLKSKLYARKDMTMIDRCYIEITNTCNLNCHFCPKHTRKKRQLSAEEFDLLTDKIRGKICFLYFHIMGEPLLHPLLPKFINMAREKGFKTVLTSNGTLLPKAMDLLDTLPHKIQLSLHSHESNAKGELASYMNEVMTFSTQAAEKGTCIVLRLWNQGGKDLENEEVMGHIEKFVPKPWKERPDGYRLANNLYLEFDRKFEWPNFDNHIEEKEMIKGNQKSGIREEKREVFCKALLKQIGVLADGTLVPCCLDHNGDVALGNLLEQSLEEILASPRAQAMIEGFKHHQATEHLCETCESALVRNSFRGKARS